MRDSKTSVSGVIAYSLWAVVALLMVSSWVALHLGFWETAVIIGLTGCATSATAAVAHIRCYAIRISCMIRNLYGIADAGDEGGGDATPFRVRQVP